MTGNCLNVLGVIKYNKSAYTDALPLLEEALDIRKELEDEKGIGRSYLNIGRIYLHQGNTKKALELAEIGIEYSKRVGDTKNVIRSYNDIGIVYGTLRDLQKASFYFLEGLKIAEESQILDGLAQTYGNLGVLYKIKRDYKQAIQYYRKAISINKRQNDKLGLAVTMSALGHLYYDQGNHKRCLQILDSANVTFKSIDHKFHIGKNYGLMGSIHRKNGDTDKAIYYFRKAVIIGEELDTKETVAVNNSHIGQLFLDQQQEDSAFIYFNKTIKIFEESGDTNALIKTYRRIGATYSNQANLPAATNYYQQALDRAKLAKDTLAIANMHASIGGLFMEQDAFDKAIDSYNEAIKGFELLGANPRIADMNNLIAKVFNGQQKNKKAIEYGRTALYTYQKFKDTCNFGSTYLTLAQSHIALKNTDSSAFYLKNALSNALKCKNVKSTLLASVYGELGSFYENQQQKDSAFLAYKEALKYASLAKNKLILKNAAKALYPIYEERGELAKAYETFKVYHTNNEALFNKANTRALVQQEYEKELQEKAFIQKQKEAEVEKQKWIIYTMIGACLAIILIALAVYRNYRNKNRANKLLKAKNSEISKQRARLEALDLTKSRFFANISHELRTPLTLISSPLQTMLQNKKQEFTPATNELLQLMYRNTESLKGLVNDILELSKLESDKMVIEQEEISLKPLLGRIANNFDSLAKHQKIQYEYAFTNLENLTVAIDIGKTEKILNNLLSNAIKHTLSGGKITFEAAVENERLHLQVTDTGKGIAPEELPFIFDRFYQSTQPDAPIQGGTGIGLALAKELCQFMGGLINVKSTLDKGSTFTVELPLQIVDAATEAEEIKDDATLTEDELLLVDDVKLDKKYTILVVEDHPDMQAYINSLIAPDYTTFLAANGKEALKILNQEPIDLVISDVMMPEMDGYTLLQEIKQSDNYNHLSVIMLTALGDDAHKLQALTIGVDDYVTKPFSADELLARIHNLLKRHEVRLQLKAEETAEKAKKTVIIENDTREEEEPVSHQLEIDWLKKVEKEIASNLENENFRLTDLADQFNLSYRQFLRRIKRLTGLSLKQYQQEIALQKARELLEKRVYGNASAIAYTVGINNVTRFSKLYEARFGKKPSKYFANFNSV